MAKTEYRRLLRAQNNAESIKRDSPLFSILQAGNTDIYKAIKQSKGAGMRKISKLVVNEKTYVGDSVASGFYDSLLGLKTITPGSIQDPTTYARYVADYDNIMKLCSNDPSIPNISIEKTSEILTKIRPQVNDLYSITANHYLQSPCRLCWGSSLLCSPKCTHQGC